MLTPKKTVFFPLKNRMAFWHLKGAWDSSLCSDKEKAEQTENTFQKIFLDPPEKWGHRQNHYPFNLEKLANKRIPTYQTRNS